MLCAVINLNKSKVEKDKIKIKILQDKITIEILQRAAIKTDSYYK